jgi:hypothetical protein
MALDRLGHLDESAVDGLPAGTIERIEQSGDACGGHLRHFANDVAAGKLQARIVARRDTHLVVAEASGHRDHGVG